MRERRIDAAVCDVSTNKVSVASSSKGLVVFIVLFFVRDSEKVDLREVKPAWSPFTSALPQKPALLSFSWASSCL